MGIEAKFSMDDVKAKISAFERKRNAAILMKLQYIGEKCVNHARGLDTYQDQSGNLRNSIGYVIAYNGAVLFKSFPGEVESAEAVDQSLTVANEKASKYSGWVLIVVAGMEYALSVESKGYDVLSSSEHLAEQLLSQMLKKK
jgi:hypothetical protein